MFLSRLELRPEAARHPEFWAGLEDFYKSHQAIWQLFADRPDRKRDFLFRKEGQGAAARWFTLSEREPSDTRGFWRIESKAFSPQLGAGDRLEFSVRVNPTVAKTPASVTRPLPGKEEGKRRLRKSSVRHDVVMNAKRVAADSGRSEPENVLVTRACSAWLDSRSQASGFNLEVDSVMVSGYRQLGARPGRGIRLTVVDLQGVLEVRDPQRFNQMLFHGLGPAKGFGCGLMLVRRA